MSFVSPNLIERKDRDIAWRDAKLQKITFELAQLKRWKFGAKSEAMLLSSIESGRASPTALRCVRDRNFCIPPLALWTPGAPNTRADSNVADMARDRTRLA